MPQRTDGGLPRVWRVPSWQVAGLILVATGALAMDIYVHLSVGWRVFFGIVAAACLAGAGFAMRFLMVADDNGIWVRQVFHTYLVEWDDVADVEVVVGRKNSTTLRITKQDGKYVEVPPSLLLPALPTNVRKVRALMGGTARTLLDLAHQQQRA